MADAPFDPAGAVTFDLSTGNVNVAYSPRRVLVPVDGLAHLCEAAGEDAACGLGFALGAAMGFRIARRLGDGAGNGSVRDALSGVSVGRFIEHLSGEFALAGLGLVGMEQWGRALLFVVRGATVSNPFTASVLDGAIREATGRSSFCVSLSESGDGTRFLAIGQHGAKLVAEWLAQGVFWGDVLVRLQDLKDLRNQRNSKIPRSQKNPRSQRSTRSSKRVPAGGDA